MSEIPKIVSIISFGCKVNSYESACIAEDFSQKYKVVSKYNAEAVIFIVNTCAVTARAGAKCRQTIRKILKLKEVNSRVVLVVTGCLANVESDSLKEIGDIDYFIKDKSQIFNIVHDLENPVQSTGYIEQKTNKMYNRTRAFVKIQDGCNFFCAYCIIPYARGVPTFRDFGDVIKQIEILVENGYREVVLGGINIGLYNYHGKNLKDLLFAIEEIAGLKRMRISSIEPQHVKSIWNFICSSKKLVHHLHIPLQSGSDEILQAMGRRYEAKEFEDLVEDLKKFDSHFAIGCDVIVGFPNESEENFQESYSFIKKLPLSYLHVFPYSLRRGTKAAGMNGHLSQEIKKRRAHLLGELSLTKKREFAELLIKDKVVLTAQLEQKKGNYATGVSDRYLPVYVADLPADGREVQILPGTLFNDGVLGKWNGLK